MRTEEEIKSLIVYYKEKLAQARISKFTGSSRYYETELNIHVLQNTIGWLLWFLGEE